MVGMIAKLRNFRAIKKILSALKNKSLNGKTQKSYSEGLFALLMIPFRWGLKPQMPDLLRISCLFCFHTYVQAETA
jgi:hypothetical protein